MENKPTPFLLLQTKFLHFRATFVNLVNLVDFFLPVTLTNYFWCIRKGKTNLKQNHPPQLSFRILAVQANYSIS